MRAILALSQDQKKWSGGEKGLLARVHILKTLELSAPHCALVYDCNYDSNSESRITSHLRQSVQGCDLMHRRQHCDSNGDLNRGSSHKLCNSDLRFELPKNSDLGDTLGIRISLAIYDLEHLALEISENPACLKALENDWESHCLQEIH